MSSLAVTNALMSVFVPIGIAGAVIALACALVAAFALMRGAAGLAGGAIGVWIVGAMLSLSASFANLWMPVAVSLVALGAALVVGPVLRLLIRAGASRRAAAATAGDDPHAATAVEAPASAVRVAPAASAAAVTPVASGSRPASGRSVPPRTEALPIAS